MIYQNGVSLFNVISNSDPEAEQELAGKGQAVAVLSHAMLVVEGTPLTDSDFGNNVKGAMLVGDVFFAPTGNKGELQAQLSAQYINAATRATLATATTKGVTLGMFMHSTDKPTKETALLPKAGIKGTGIKVQITENKTAGHGPVLVLTAPVGSLEAFRLAKE
jgi:hypothetical protein